MARRGVISTLNAIARTQAREQRQFEVEQRRLQRARDKAARDDVRLTKLQQKEDKQRYLEARIEETTDNNAELAESIDTLEKILEHTLSINDIITFESLRIRNEYSPPPIPQDLLVAKPVPNKQAFLAQVKAPGFLENALGLTGRYQREVQIAETQFQAALASYKESEKERELRLQELLAQNELARQGYNLKAEQRNQEVDDLELGYQNGEIAAVITYSSMVLERSEYPDDFPQKFRLAYAPEARELVVEYDLPSVDVIPNVAEYKYSKTKDQIEEKPRRPAEIKTLYQDIIASVTLRTIHELFEGDQGNYLDVVTFNGFVQSVDPATGQDVRPCLVSVRATRDRFMEINLARIDKRACLRNLGAQVSPQPQAMQPVKPVVEFDMVDKRFVEQSDVLGDLESRPNLMDLSPSEFEALVSNLFGKMGLETKLTRASRDGGVDAVAFDLRPVLGGKVVIQAKRHKNTVGVSAVRDLYGTMLN